MGLSGLVRIILQWNKDGFIYLREKKKKMKVVKEYFILTLVIPIILTWSLPLSSFLSLSHATGSNTSFENIISQVFATGLLYRYCI